MHRWLGRGEVALAVLQGTWVHGRDSSSGTREATPCEGVTLVTDRGIVVVPTGGDGVGDGDVCVSAGDALVRQAWSPGMAVLRGVLRDTPAPHAAAIYAPAAGGDSIDGGIAAPPPIDHDWCLWRSDSRVSSPDATSSPPGHSHPVVVSYASAWHREFVVGFARAWGGVACDVAPTPAARPGGGTDAAPCLSHAAIPGFTLLGEIPVAGSTAADPSEAASEAEASAVDGRDARSAPLASPPSLPPRCHGSSSVSGIDHGIPTLLPPAIYRAVALGACTDDEVVQSVEECIMAAALACDPVLPAYFSMACVRGIVADVRGADGGGGSGGVVPNNVSCVTWRGRLSKLRLACLLRELIDRKRAAVRAVVSGGVDIGVLDVPELAAAASARVCLADPVTRQALLARPGSPDVRAHTLIHDALSSCTPSEAAHQATSDVRLAQLADYLPPQVAARELARLGRHSAT